MDRTSMSTVPDLKLMRAARAEIDLAAFRRNVDALIRQLPAGAKLVAVLKADAYGHGAVELAKTLDDRVPMIAVAILEEALELRAAGINRPILVLGAMTRAQIAAAAGRGIITAIPSPETLEAAADVAQETDVEIHLKIDSGMGRTGLKPGDLPAAVELLKATQRLRLGGIYTHFANAPDPADPFTVEQVAVFDALVEELRASGIEAPVTHLANSAATVRGLVRPGELARVGIALFGAETLDDHSHRLEPVMRWRTEIVRVKEIGPGEGVGYGLTFRASAAMKIATIAVGYADGYNRLLSNRGEVLLRGRRARVVGRVSMDLVTLDVSDFEDVAVGDEVVLIGRQGDEEIAAEELAERLGTISYEVLCAVGARVPRIYRDGERLVAVRSRFDR
jgi:alanine racemase